MDHEPHVCPPWVGYLLASPLRRLFENPHARLAAHVRPGMTVLEVGCAMGFYSLPLARLVGPAGRVLCVDVQEAMLTALRRRADRARLGDRIVTHLALARDLGLEERHGSVDFALAANVVHEAPDAAGLLRQIGALLAPGGAALLIEPRGHVSRPAFDHTLALAAEAGLRLDDAPRPRRALIALLRKPARG